MGYKAAPTVTTEDQLKLMREGNNAELKLTYNKLEVRCRLMSATEEASVISNAKLEAKVPEGHDRALLVSMAVMKAVLAAACFVEGTPYLGRALLDQLTSTELEALYDQYMTIKHTASPQFESLSPEQIADLMAAVKKKEKNSSDFFTWQLAAVGKFFLDHLLPRDSVAGS